MPSVVSLSLAPGSIDVIQREGFNDLVIIHQGATRQVVGRDFVLGQAVAVFYNGSRVAYTPNWGYVSPLLRWSINAAFGFTLEVVTGPPGSNPTPTIAPLPAPAPAPAPTPTPAPVPPPPTQQVRTWEIRFAGSTPANNSIAALVLNLALQPMQLLGKYDISVRAEGNSIVLRYSELHNVAPLVIAGIILALGYLVGWIMQSWSAAVVAGAAADAGVKTTENTQDTLLQVARDPTIPDSMKQYIIDALLKAQQQGLGPIGSVAQGTEISSLISGITPLIMLAIVASIAGSFKSK